MDDETKYKFASNDYLVDYEKIAIKESNSLTLTKPNLASSISFNNDEGKKVGEFVIKNNRITFSGEIDESMLVFLQYLYQLFPRKYNSKDYDELKEYDNLTVNGFNDTTYDNVYFDYTTDEYVVLLDEGKTSITVSGVNRARWAKMISIVAKDIDVNE